MNRFLPCLMCILVSQSGCDTESKPGPDLHDVKYVALDDQGKRMLAPGATAACVLDQHTGLVWEMKTDRPGLHDWRNTYSWFDPGEEHGADVLDYRGRPDGGVCAGSDCDTWAMVEAVNDRGLCGFSDWRMPLREELASISDPRKKQNPPTINTDYFPYAQTGEYWSGNDYQFQYNAAWLWNFRYGHDRVEWKKTARFVRLVRGVAASLPEVRE